MQFGLIVGLTTSTYALAIIGSYRSYLDLISCPKAPPLRLLQTRPAQIERRLKGIEWIEIGRNYEIV